MGQRLDLDEQQILEIHGNEMVLTLTLEDHDKICARIESAEGDRQIGIKPHPEDSQTLVFYLKDAGPKFRVI